MFAWILCIPIGLFGRLWQLVKPKRHVPLSTWCQSFWVQNMLGRKRLGNTGGGSAVDSRRNQECAGWR